MATNLTGVLPSMLLDTMLVSSGSICLYPVPLKRTVKFTAATLVRFLKQLHHKTFRHRMLTIVLKNLSYIFHFF